MNKKTIGRKNGMTVASMTCDGKFTNFETGYNVIFDDNGRVAYAYLLAPDERIVADVWLYNRCETPLQPEWPDQEKMPFANPASYSKNHGDFLPVSDISDISVEWHDKAKVKASIFIRGELFAILTEGSKPGWCVMAKQNGPLANILE